jgi:hypothetical protein
MNNSAAFLLILCTSMLISCDNDDEKQKMCFPINLRSATDSIVYEYNSSRRLTRILYYSNSTQISRRDEVSYDSKRQLSHVRRIHVLYDGTEDVYETYELIYDSEGKPKTLTLWLYEMTPPAQVTTFSHDANGRLLTRKIELGFSFGFFSTYRYEYDEKGNVLRTYYRPYGVQEEVLGDENITFDPHLRFYANMKDLEILNLYVFKYEPSKNNRLTTIVYWDSPSGKYETPKTVNYLTTYNTDGLINSLRQDYLFLPGFTFYNLNYECR